MQTKRMVEFSFFKTEESNEQKKMNIVFRFRFGIFDPLMKITYAYYRYPTRMIRSIMIEMEVMKSIKRQISLYGPYHIAHMNWPI